MSLVCRVSRTVALVALVTSAGACVADDPLADDLAGDVTGRAGPMVDYAVSLTGDPRVAMTLTVTNAGDLRSEFGFYNAFVLVRDAAGTLVQGWPLALEVRIDALDPGASVTIPLRGCNWVGCDDPVPAGGTRVFTASAWPRTIISGGWWFPLEGPAEEPSIDNNSVTIPF